MEVRAIVIYLLILFSTRCQPAPATVGASRGWTIGSGIKYHLTTIFLSRESGTPKPGGDVGFQITGDVSVKAIWQEPRDLDVLLLEIKLSSPQLYIKSRKAPEPEGFVEHSSKLDEISENPVYALWKNGEILKIYLGQDETISSGNLKRGIASLFQYRTLDGNYHEHDTSGLCNVSYVSNGPQTLTKTKKTCEQINLSRDEHPSPILGVNVESNRISKYVLNPSFLPIKIEEAEVHEVTLRAKPEVGTTITSQRILKQVQTLTSNRIDGRTVNDVIAHLQPGYREVEIGLQIEPITCPESGCKSLEEVIEKNRDSLANSALGTAKSAAAFLKLIQLVRDASPEELAKILKSPKYLTLRTQLLDVLGSAATTATHQAAMKVLRQDDSGDDTERYLWALSMSPIPSVDIIKDVLKRSEETLQNERVSETLALTAAAMAQRTLNPAVIDHARISLELGLDTCTGDDCRLKFLRALRNLRSKASLPVLMNYAVNGTRITSVAAWRAIGSLKLKHIPNYLKVSAKRTFYQIGGPKRDSSARTLAADVILENEPSIEDLREFLEYISTSDTMYEVRRYLSQRMEQLGEKDVNFREKLNAAIRAEERRIQNYNVLSYRGLSTAFSRPFLTSSASNGSLVTVQEINSGLLKRGVVDVMMQTGPHEEALFSLGLFAGGLGSFVSSNPEDEPADENEVATAGMEIGVLGVGIRPFVFFSGQGELMGHVWSGTASERTPAFQAIANLHRHRELIPLGIGFIAEVDVEGAVSVDLSGQIQLSLWSRNAQSLVEMGAGVAVRGGFRINSDFVKNTAEFALTLEPKLELSTDVDFSGPVSLCMRLMQPETSVKHQIYKIERIPGSRHRLRKTRKVIQPAPAKSYLLNKKNNEMCTKVFS